MSPVSAAFIRETCASRAAVRYVPDNAPVVDGGSLPPVVDPHSPRCGGGVTPSGRRPPIPPVREDGRVRTQSLDDQVTALARRIAELGEGERTRVFQMSWWSDRMLQWAMSHPSFKTQLFRFVDVFPATTDDADVLRHLEEYFELADVPRTLDLGLGVADRVPFGKAVSASVARRNITRMAEQFIVGTSPEEAVAGLHRLWRQGSAF